MEDTNQDTSALKEIQKLMEQSSRFISLSGLGGIAAGICAIVGALVVRYIVTNSGFSLMVIQQYGASPIPASLKIQLLLTAGATLLAAFIFAFFATYRRTKKQHMPIWGFAVKRMLINGIFPMLAGAVVILKVLSVDALWLVIPLCLVFYGLALVNASKYTVGNIRYLGYLFVLLGCANLWCEGYGFCFWVGGFGCLHILYGIYMWYMFEKS